MGKLARKVAIVGAGMSKFGFNYPKMRMIDMWQEAWLEAVKLTDKGIKPEDIDELFLGNFTADLFNHQGHLAPLMANLIGLSPKPSSRFEAACASSGIAFRHAVMSIASGMNDVVCVGGVEQMNELNTAGVTSALAAAADTTYEYYAGATFPGLYAAVATAHFHKYGTTSKDLMNIAIKNYENGKENPFAHVQSTIPEVMAKAIEKAKKRGQPVPNWKDEYEFLESSKNPMIASPLRLFDCSLVTDGAAIIFLASEELAYKFTDHPIWVSGIGQGSASLSLHDRKDGKLTTFDATKEAARQAYDMAGLTPEDIQIAEVHDCFTIAELVALEDLGFYKPGEAVKAIANGETKRDGKRPINTSGGLKTKGHPVGATGASQIVEIYKQLAGKAERNRQVQGDLKVGLAQNLGGSGATATVTIMTKEKL
ncbi:3-ketoacyl-CoA thiolase [Candidatus Lokiarchaeum ossiferum]|uniref:3-ketoacyl-CoA thiolase n=1 Tax=Candidatus Lokiarchaeum ossiferum TaxID=2951803 RepID=A0ABY6HUQ9_9ARCH|nr:3-ketoacyl-CoA thiolase [Candidatus Lokiarchaeum sp. B-35]